ncbi:hypothetical protein OX283_004835 [Flavobacterium sp. SUN052]|uniref:hypothetical protein n=1 Tax=Flavobacterium sp. SUN052 TaxID=3002441 RepID=UPI00237D9F5D|nr:hypothetical protein [Flavobacterium sp. SUN052]MEC4003972.1 hypothetical protein [Flavobacterium sp. SUN052]
MSNLTTNNGLESAIFEMPNKVLVTTITYQNGLTSKMITGIPRGINSMEIEMSLKNSLSTQKNVLASQSTLFVKGDNGLEVFYESAKVEYNNENRLHPISCEAFFTSFGTA